MPDTLQLEPRTTGGKQAVKAIRAAGRIPGILYGRGKEPLAFQVGVPALRDALSGDAGRHAVLTLKAPGRRGEVNAVLKDYQLDPVRDWLVHIDLLEISMDELIVATVAVHLDGEPPGVKDGGVLEQPTHEIEVEALPGNLPPEILVDVSGLQLGQSLKLADLTAPEGVTFASPPDTVLASIIQPTTMEEIEAEAAEGEEGEEGETTGEAGEAPAAGGEAPSE
jgi:large subunit ribosomal protein L25